MSVSPAQNLARALRLIEAVWQETQAGPFTQADMQKPVDRLPDFSESAAVALSAKAKTLLPQIDTIDTRIPANAWRWLSIHRCRELALHASSMPSSRSAASR